MMHVGCLLKHFFLKFLQFPVSKQDTLAPLTRIDYFFYCKLNAFIDISHEPGLRLEWMSQHTQEGISRVTENGFV